MPALDAVVLFTADMRPFDSSQVTFSINDRALENPKVIGEAMVIRSMLKPTSGKVVWRKRRERTGREYDEEGSKVELGDVRGGTEWISHGI